MQSHFARMSSSIAKRLSGQPTAVWVLSVLVLLMLALLLFDGRIVIVNNSGGRISMLVQNGDGGRRDSTAADENDDSSSDVELLSPARSTAAMVPACHVLAKKIASSMECTASSAKDPLVSFVDALEASRADKKVHFYGHMYAEYLDAMRLQGEVNMMEIGLKFGGSVEVWTDFFKKGRVYGMDLWVFGKDAMTAKMNPRIKIFEGDQANVTFLKQTTAAIKKEVGLLDFIVDDGGHTMTQQITSFTHLLSLVKPGGFYFIEDLETSYFSHCPRHCYGGGKVGKKGTTIDMIKSLIDVLNADFFNGHTETVGKGFYTVNPADKLVGSIQCWRNMCAIRRKFEGSFF